MKKEPEIRGAEPGQRTLANVFIRSQPAARHRYEDNPGGNRQVLQRAAGPAQR